ncbi:MAG: hypothetical protein AAFX99_30035, partial [Myxococcota bacterium]
MPTGVDPGEHDFERSAAVIMKVALIKEHDCLGPKGIPTHPGRRQRRGHRSGTVLCTTTVRGGG